MVFVFIGYKALLDVLIFPWGLWYSFYVASVCTVGISGKVYAICFKKHITYEDVEQKST